MSTVPTATLNNGHGIPLVGLGSWMMAPCKPGDANNDEAYQMIKSALEVGYVHYDTASFYGNEEVLGQAIRESKIARNQLFVTTKLAQSDHHNVAQALERSLDSLNAEYIDLWLMHWPHAMIDGKTIPLDQSPTFNETWKEMEKALEGGKVRSIGVSNFSIKNLEILLKDAKVVPAVNQIELHPYLPQHELVEYCQKLGCHVTSYCPLGQGNSPILKEEVVLAIAKAHDCSAGQVLLSWNVQRGVSVVPKSANPERQKNNLTLVTLTDDERKQIDNIHNEEGKYISLCSYSGGNKVPGELFGLKLKEDLGWDYELTRD